MGQGVKEELVSLKINKKKNKDSLGLVEDLKLFLQYLSSRRVIPHYRAIWARQTLRTRERDYEEKTFSSSDPNG